MSVIDIDVVVVGGGQAGLASARARSRSRPPSSTPRHRFRLTGSVASLTGGVVMRCGPPTSRT